MDRWVTNLSGLPHLYLGSPTFMKTGTYNPLYALRSLRSYFTAVPGLLVVQFTCNFLRFPQISDLITTLTNLKKFNSFFKSAP